MYHIDLFLIRTQNKILSQLFKHSEIFNILLYIKRHKTLGFNV